MAVPLLVAVTVTRGTSPASHLRDREGLLQLDHRLLHDDARLADRKHDLVPDLVDVADRGDRGGAAVADHQAVLVAGDVVDPGDEVDPEVEASVVAR